MMTRHVQRQLASLALVAMISTMASPIHAQGAPSDLFGTWRGTSLCTDRVLLPACNDETVIYVFTNGPKLGMAHVAADKVVNGQREPMGEFDLNYDKTEGCWKAEFSSARGNSVWCLAVTGAQLSGTLQHLPGKEILRKVSLRKD